MLSFASTQLRRRTPRRPATIPSILAAALLAAACAAPGTTPAPPTPAASAAAPAASAAASAAAGSQAPASAAASAVASGPTCGTQPVTLNAWFETGFQLPFSLSTEFTKEYPNVTWKISQDQFTNLINETPRLLAGDNPPDLIRLPTMVTLVKDGLLKNLDSYATAFGWDQWPSSELAQNRVGPTGVGSGSLYAMGLNYSMTGVFYNKKLAAQIGMAQPPATLAELDALLAKAKAAGLQPIMQWNASASGGGLAFPLQDLMADYGPASAINDWIFQKQGATINTPANLQAAQHLQKWIQAGYFPKDVNAIQYTDSNGRFEKGEGVFTFNGDWEDANYDKQMPGNIGFFLFPPATSGGGYAAMSSPLTYGIAAKAKNADCAAFFFNWVATNATARQIDVSVGGSYPGGPPDLPVPPAASGSIINDTLASAQTVFKDNGTMGFIANATGSIFAQGWTPELQKMVGGQETPAGMLNYVQTQYLKELGS
jgi:raffinose/stachyose/melibiose transport system substrate-binding protein